MKHSNNPNNFTISYGLIVKTNDDRIIMIKRKVPYCVQNFYVYLHKNNIPYRGTTHNPFHQIKDLFEEKWLPTLSESDRLDYMRFTKGEIFEDLYDFPHGQLSHNDPQDLYQYFRNSYREFCEETGYKFNFASSDIKKYPIVKVEFIGCDQIHYTQYYFIVENVNGLRRNRYFDSYELPLLSTVKVKSWNDDRLIFKTQKLSTSEAYMVLERQQKIKIDYKHLLLKDSLPKYYLICCYQDNENEVVKKIFNKKKTNENKVV